MVDFAPLQTLGGPLAPARPAAGDRAVAVTPVAAAPGGRGAEARMDTAPDLPQRKPVPRPGATDTAQQRRLSQEDAAHPGPPPAFQANVLELERDLQRVIDRLEAERGRVEAEAAIRPEPAKASAKPPEDAAKTPAPAATTDDAPETEPQS